MIASPSTWRSGAGRSPAARSHASRSGSHGLAGGRAPMRGAEARRLRVLLAPDSFKGSLTPSRWRGPGCGWSRARPGDELILAPLADAARARCGDRESGGWEWQECPAHDALSRPLTARWLRSLDLERGAVELAEASGCRACPPMSRAPRSRPRQRDGRDPAGVLDAGVRHVVMGVGGSATTDGGSGLLRALGCVSRRLPSHSRTDPDLAAVDFAIWTCA